MARALNQATNLLEKVQVQVKERTVLKDENELLSAELAKAKQASLKQAACDDSQDALLAQAQADVEAANERADEAEREVDWLNTQRTAWIKALLDDIDKSFDVFSADTHKAKKKLRAKEDRIYSALIDNLHGIVEKHLPSTPSPSSTTSTKRPTSPTVQDEPGSADKRAHLA